MLWRAFEGQTSYNKNVLYCQLFWYVCRHFYMVYVSTHRSIWHHFVINKIWFAVIWLFFIHNPLLLNISLGNKHWILAQAQEEHRCIIVLILVPQENQSKWREKKKRNQAGGGRKTRRALEREEACWREPSRSWVWPREQKRWAQKGEWAGGGDPGRWEPLGVGCFSSPQQDPLLLLAKP